MQQQAPAGAAHQGPTDAFVAEDGLAKPLAQAFDDLVEEHASFAYSVAFRMLRNSQDAEDAVQEAFISAHKAFPRFRGQSKLSTWLYRIVVNVCLMKIRKDKNQSKYVAETGLENARSDWRSDPESEAVNSELRDVLEGALDRLGPELRVAIVLKDVQGFSNGEAAEVLDMTISAFKSRLHRARILLREYLVPYGLKAKQVIPQRTKRPVTSVEAQAASRRAPSTLTIGVDAPSNQVQFASIQSLNIPSPEAPMPRQIGASTRTLRRG
jgi:RNA polymerase sigma-70 factor (ECF subfamily)